MDTIANYYARIPRTEAAAQYRRLRASRADYARAIFTARRAVGTSGKHP